MEPILNYTPQVYEAIIAAFAVVSVIAVWALARKHQQTEKLKSVLKTVITEATQAVMTGAMVSAIQVAKAKAETRRIAKAADNLAETSEAAINALQNRVDELEAEDDRIDDLEQRLDTLENDDDARTHADAGTKAHADIEARLFPFGSPGPFAGGDRLDTSLDALFASLGRNGLSPTGRRTGAPSIRAFKITPRGLEPVKGPEDFFGGSTFNREPTGERKPLSLATLLSLLASLPPPPRSPRPFPSFAEFMSTLGAPRAPHADENAKADLSSGPGAFLYDDHGPAAPGDAYADAADAARASVTGGPTQDGAGLGERPDAFHATADAEACDTQRPASRTYDETHTPAGDRCEAGDPAAISPTPLAGGRESPADDPGARAPARAPYDHHASKLTNGDGSPRDRYGFDSPSPRAG